MSGSNCSFEETVTTRLKRTGHLIKVENPDLSVTFHPTDIDKTYDAIISKCNDLYPSYQWTDIQLRDIDVQLTEIYKDYHEDRKKHKVKDAEHLVNLAKSQIKEQFRDQTGAFYVVIERDGHDEMLKSSSLEFDRYLYRIYYDADTGFGFFLLFSSNQAILMSVAPYPPFGIATVTAMGLAAYLVVVGLYTSTISLSQDTELRRNIRRLARSQTRLFDSMVTAESEKEIEKRVLELIKRQSIEMETRTGVGTSLDEQEAKRYIEEVIREIKK